jgi:hypothetical protein
MLNDYKELALGDSIKSVLTSFLLDIETDSVKNVCKQSQAVSLHSRQHPNLLPVELTHSDDDGGKYVLNHPKHGSVAIGSEADWTAKASPVFLWDIFVGGEIVDCGDEAAEFISRIAFGEGGEGARLVYHPK